MKKYVLQIIMNFIVGICLIGCVCAAEQTQEIKVGYVSNYGNLKAGFSQGSEGYGYEYLNNLVNYMEGDYTLLYVGCTSWQDGLDKLDSGEIDILGPTTMSEDSGYIYTTQDFGTCRFMLAEISSSEAVDVNTSNLDGATIAVPDYYTDYSFLNDFIEGEGVDVTVVTIPSQDLNLTVGLGDYDYVWMSSLQTHSGFTIVTALDSYPVYFVARPENQVLIDEMSRGLVALEAAEPYFESQLALDYSSYNYTTNAYISESNLALVQEKGVYTVGVRNFYSPIVREGEDGALEGVAFTMLDMLAEAADISFVYVLLEDGATDEDFASVDFVVAATDYTTELGFPYKSSTYLDLPMMLVEQRESSIEEDASQTIGVVDYYCTDMLVSADGTLYGREVIKYDTIQAIQQAFDGGEIDCMLITVVALNMIRNDLESHDYIATAVEDSLQLSLAFSEHMSSQEITVFDKLISTNDQSVLEAAVLEYSLTGQTSTLKSILEDNPWIIVNGVVALILVGVLVGVISELRRRILMTRSLNFDELTGLLSQRKLIEDALCILKENPGNRYHLVSLDIDNFKYVNEMYGYDTGSRLLQLVAGYIQKEVTSDTVIARSAGDNFLLLAQANQSQKSFAQWENLDEYLQKEIEETLQLSCHINFSIGVCEITDPTLDFNVVIDYANIARQMGKGTTGFTFHYFTEKMAADRVTNNEITTAMVPAIRDEEFVLYYQPKLDMNTETVVGAEVLVRWVRGDSVMPPNRFIPLFEKNGFIETLDYYVLDHTCMFLQNHSELNIPRLSVNISGVSMLQSRVVKRILDILATYGIEPSRIDLEITETAFVENSAVLEHMAQLRSHGFTISMDDFGTGVSSLNRLKNMELDTLKIDREFIIDSIENPRGNQILRSVMRMATALDLETVAEGIETEEQRIFLKDLGCNVGQGYFFACPLPAEDFIAYCKEHCTNPK